MQKLHFIPLILWAVLLFGGFLLGNDPDNRQRIPMLARLGSSLMLVIWAWWLVVSLDVPRDVALIIGVGMTLGFVGDLFMARIIPIGPYPLGGMAAFGIGHIAYITAFLRYGSEAPANNRLMVWGAWLLVAVVAWFLVVYRPAEQREAIHYVALPYALLLASTAGVAHGLALGNAAFIPLTIGAALFLISDLLIAAELFSGISFPLIGDVIWLTYGPAQALIVGVLWVMQSLKL